MKKKLWMIMAVLVCMVALSLPQSVCAEGAVHLRMDNMVKQKNTLYFADGRGIVTYNINTKKQSRLVKTKNGIRGMLYYKSELYWSQYNSKKQQYSFYKLNLKSKEKTLIYKAGRAGFIKGGRIYLDEELDKENKHALISVNLEGQDKQVHVNWSWKWDDEPVNWMFSPFYSDGRYYFGDMGQYSVASDFTGKKKVNPDKAYKKATKAFKSFISSAYDFDGKTIYSSAIYTDSGKFSKSTIVLSSKGKETVVYQSKNKWLEILACDYGYLVIKDGKNTILLNKKFKKVTNIH